MSLRLFKALIIIPMVTGWFVGSLALGNDQLVFTALVIPNQVVVKNHETPGMSILMELRVDNFSKSTSTRSGVLIDKFETPTLVITGDQGLVPSSYGLDTVYAPEKSDFHVIWPSQTTYIPIECGLGIWPDGQIYLGYMARGGQGWKIGPMKKGTYQIVLQYQVKNKASHALEMEDGSPGFARWTLAPWEGTVRTPPVEFTIR